MNNYLKNIYYIIISMRPKDWLKNIFIFAPLLFSKNLGNSQLVLNSILAFILFCIVASCIYIINDISDYEKDKFHPIKKNRPLPSGKTNKNILLIFISLIFPTSIMISFIFNFNFGIIIGQYI
ncbi:uncharacterized protein METZ01_LOCUS315221, partial [marine metagenome]